MRGSIAGDALRVYALKPPSSTAPAGDVRTERLHRASGFFGAEPVTWNAKNCWNEMRRTLVGKRDAKGMSARRSRNAIPRALWASHFWTANDVVILVPAFDPDSNDWVADCGAVLKDRAGPDQTPLFLPPYGEVSLAIGARQSLAFLCC